MVTAFSGYGDTDSRSSSSAVAGGRVTQSWAGVTKLSLVCNAYVADANFTLYGVKK